MSARMVRYRLFRFYHKTKKRRDVQYESSQSLGDGSRVEHVEWNAAQENILYSQWNSARKRWARIRKDLKTRQEGDLSTELLLSEILQYPCPRLALIYALCFPASQQLVDSTAGKKWDAGDRPTSRSSPHAACSSAACAGWSCCCRRLREDRVRTNLAMGGGRGSCAQGPAEGTGRQQALADFNQQRYPSALRGFQQLKQLQPDNHEILVAIAQVDLEPPPPAFSSLAPDSSSHGRYAGSARRAAGCSRSPRSSQSKSLGDLRQDRRLAESSWSCNPLSPAISSFSFSCPFSLSCPSAWDYTQALRAYDAALDVSPNQVVRGGGEKTGGKEER
eukprot:764948-Hanusia_phi.AAC.7